MLAVAVTLDRPVDVQRLHLGRALRVDDRLERLVLDANRRSGAPCLLGLLGGDDGDRFAEVADPVDREHWLVRELEPVQLLPRHVLLGEHGVHSGQAKCFGDVDLEDARMRVRASNCLPPEHVGGVQIARVRERTGHLRNRILARLGGRGVTAPESRSRRSAHRPAARCTASRIFW